MAVEIIDSFRLGTDLPLDSRYVVESIYDVSAYWYDGMLLYNASTKDLWIVKDASLEVIKEILDSSSNIILSLDQSLNNLFSWNENQDSSIELLNSEINWLDSDKVNGSGLSPQVTFWGSSKTLMGNSKFLFYPDLQQLLIGTDISDNSSTVVIDNGVTPYNTVAKFLGTLDGFIQTEIRNQSSGPSASADVVASNDIGEDETNYIDMGINSTTYNAGDSLPGDGYLLLVTDASVLAGNLLIGNATFGKDLILFTGEGIDAYTNEKIRITFDGSVLIGKPTSEKYKLEVNGDINVPAGNTYRINGLDIGVVDVDKAYVDGSLFTRDSSIIWLFGNTLSRAQLDASLVIYVPYTGAKTDISLGTHGISLQSIQFDTNSSVGFMEGKLSWDVNYETLKLNLDNDVNLQIGQENYVYVKNNTGVTIPNGKVVYITGVSGIYPTVDLAIADNVNTSKAIGLSTMDIVPGGLGYITNLGIVHDLNTNAWLNGDRLYLSDVSAGELSDTPGLVWAFIGIVLEVSATTGSILINPQDLTSLTGLTDVLIASLNINQVLTWNGLHWINANTGTVSAGSGVVYFLSSIDSDISTYEEMSREPQVSVEEIEVRTVNSGTSPILIDNYASPSTGLQVSLLDGGVWKFNTYASMSNIVAGSQISIHTYKRNYLGVETSLFSVTTTPLISLTPILTITASVQPSFIVDPSDRLIFKYEISTDSVTDVSVSFYHGGTEHYSYVNTPLSTLHNDLAGIQGGNSNERYHLTLAEKTVVGNTSGVNTGDQDLAPYAVKTNVDASFASAYSYNENRYFKESSIGTGFTWDAGKLNTVSQSYVDGSLALRDTSISFLNNYRIIQDISIATLNIRDNAQDVSIAYLNTNKTSKFYVDGSLNARDLSINDLYLEIASAYGTQYQLASDLTTTSTTATTPQPKVTMTTTNLPAGTYKIVAHWMWSRNSAANSARFNITIGGVAQGTRTTMEMEAGDTTDIRPETRIFYKALSGVNTIILNYWGESAANSTSISDATIELIRVS
jgi:hypothetical protein